MSARNGRRGFSLLGLGCFFFMALLVGAVAIAGYALTYKYVGLTAAILVSVVNILLLTFACLGMDVIRRRIMVYAPLKKILAGTKKIARGDFSVRFTPNHEWGDYDEFDEIMLDLNRLVEELERTELVHSDFIANVSHEIKTPLSVIDGYARLLASEGATGEQRKEYVKNLTDASASLTALVTNILKLNKLENSGILPEKKALELGDCVRDCVLSFEDKFEEKGIELVAEIEDTTVYSDRGLLEIIWNNLLSNAVKFTEYGGTITVEVKAEKTPRASAWVRVTDTGVGMSAETGARIFDKFYQGDTSRKREGNGLGLALVKRAIDILGGEITVESEIGKGTAFTVRIV